MNPLKTIAPRASCVGVAMLAGFALLSAAQPAVSQTLLEENFTFTGPLTSNGWTAVSGAGTSPINASAPGLAYPNLPSSGAGNAASISTTGEDDRKLLTATNSTGSIYSSCLVSLSAAQATGDYFYTLSSGASGFIGRVFARSSGSGFQLGILKSSGGVATPTYDTNVLSFGAVYLIATKIERLSGSTTDDVASLWVNPVLGAAEPAATVTNSAGNDQANIDSVVLRQGSAANAPTLRLGNILVGTTWASVTPTSSASAPSISTFTPTSGSAGTLVTISGSNLNGATSVTFNGVAASFTVVSPSQITATVPAAATEGPIAVTTPQGVAQSTSSFVIPTISIGIPATIKEGKTGVGTLTLNAAAGADVIVGLSTSPTNALTVDSPVNIGTGSTSATFNISAGLVSSNTTVQVSAAATGYAASPANITVQDVPAASLTSSGYAESFASFTNSTSLPLGWSLNASSVTYTAWATTDTGAKYSVAGADVFGYQHSSSTGTVEQVLTLQNDTGAPITGLTVSYIGRAARLDQTRLPSYAVTVDGIAQATLAYSTGEGDGVAKSASISGLNIAVGQVFQIVWTSDRGLTTTGTSRQIGISNVNVTVGASALPPTVANLSVNLPSITQTSAAMSADVVSDGGAALTARGFVYSATLVNSNPAIGGEGVTVVTDPSITTGALSGTLSGLNAGTGYSVRAFATNAQGTSYSGVVAFPTLAAPPSFTGSYNEAFDNFSSATSPSLATGAVVSGWTAISSTASQTYSGTWTTTSATGGFYGGVSAPGVLGYQHTSGTGTLTVTLQLVNNTGGALTQLAVSYLGRVAELTGTRSPEWLVTVAGVPAPELTYSTASGVDETKTATVSGLSVAPGESFTITWVSERGTGTGSSRRIGLANVVVGTTGPPVAAIFANPSSVTGLAATQGTPGPSSSFTASASSLSNNITVTATDSNNFAISTNNADFTNTLTLLTNATGGLSNTPVYVRLTGAAPAGAKSNTVSLVSGSASTNVIVTGTVTDPNAPSLSVSPASLTNFVTTAGTASAAQSFTVTGANLQADVIVTPPSGYQVSLDGNSWSSTVTLPRVYSAFDDFYVNVPATGGDGNYTQATWIANAGTVPYDTGLTNANTWGYAGGNFNGVGAPSSVGTYISGGNVYPLTSGGTYAGPGASYALTNGNFWIGYNDKYGTVGLPNAQTQIGKYTLEWFAGSPNYTGNTSGTNNKFLWLQGTGLSPSTDGLGAMLTWTAPNSGTFTFSGSYVNGNDGQSTSFAIVDSLNNTNLAKQTLVPSSSTNSFSFTRAYSAGDVVQFQVGTPAAAQGSPLGLSVEVTPALAISRLVYVRIAPNASAGSPGGDVTVTSTGATTRNIAVSGTVNPAPSSSLALTGTLTNFTTLQGVASAPQSFVVQGSGLTNDVTVSAPANLQFTTNTNNAYSASLVLPIAGGALSNTVFARIADAAPVGGPTTNIITASSGATNATLSAVTTVSSNTGPFIVANPTSLSGFSTTEGTPSTAQTFTASATNLTSGPLNVAASSNYEVSVDGTNFSAAVNLTPVAPAGGIEPRAGAQTYNDATNDIATGIATAGGTMDIVRMEVSDTASDLIFNLTINGNTATPNDWGNFMIGLANGKSAGATNATGNGWNRPINLITPTNGGMTHWIGSWVNGPTGGAQLWSYSGTVWQEQTAAPPAFLRTAGTQTLLSYTVPLANLGLTAGDTIFFDAYSSGGGAGDSAVDALSNTNISIAAWGGPYTSSTNTGISSYTIGGGGGGGNVAETPIYVRLRGAAAAGPAGGTVTLSGGGAVEKTVTLNGVVGPRPVVTPVSSMTPFAADLGAVSASQSFTFTAANLVGDVTVTAPTGYELSRTSGGSYSDSLTYTISEVQPGPATIWVRLSATAPAGILAGNVALASQGATTANVPVTGRVTGDPVLSVLPSSLTNFFALFGLVSESQSFTVRGVDLDGPVVLSVSNSAEWEIRGPGSTAWTNTITLVASNSAPVQLAQDSASNYGDGLAISYVGSETGLPANDYAVQNWSNPDVAKMYNTGASEVYGTAGYYQIRPMPTNSSTNIFEAAGAGNNLGIGASTDPTLASAPSFLGSATGGAGSFVNFNGYSTYRGPDGTAIYRQGALSVSVNNGPFDSPAGANGSYFGIVMSVTLNTNGNFRLGLAVDSVGSGDFAPNYVSVYNASAGGVFSGPLARDGNADMAFFDIKGASGDTFDFALWQNVGTNSVAALSLVTFDDLGARAAGWTNNSTGGSGFGPWAIATDGNATAALGNPATAGIGGMGTSAFALQGTTGYATAQRSFDAPLLPGDTFSMQWGNNFDTGGGGNKGVNLYAGGFDQANQLVNVNMGGGATITINGDPMFTQYGTNAVTLNFQYVAPGQLRVFGTGRDGIESYDRTFAVPAAPDGFSLYAGDLAPGELTQRVAYANNFAITTGSVGSSILPTEIQVRIKGTAPPTPPGQELLGSVNATTIGAAGPAVVQLSGFVTDEPRITHTSSFVPFVAVQGLPSERQTFTVGGDNLEADVLVTAPGRYQVSLDGTAWSPSVTVPRAGQVTPQQAVYIRLKSGTPVGMHGGVIQLTSVGADDVGIAVSGEVIEPMDPGKNSEFVRIAARLLFYSELNDAEVQDVLDYLGWPADGQATLAQKAQAVAELSGYVASEGIFDWAADYAQISVAFAPFARLGLVPTAQQVVDFVDTVRNGDPTPLPFPATFNGLTGAPWWATRALAQAMTDFMAGPQFSSSYPLVSGLDTRAFYNWMNTVMFPGRAMGSQGPLELTTMMNTLTASDGRAYAQGAGVAFRSVYVSVLLTEARGTSDGSDIEKPFQLRANLAALNFQLWNSWSYSVNSAEYNVSNVAALLRPPTVLPPAGPVVVQAGAAFGPEQIGVTSPSAPINQQLLFSATLDGFVDLPDWLEFNRRTGEIQGVLPADVPPGNYTLRVTAENMAGVSAPQAFQIQVMPAPAGPGPEDIWLHAQDPTASFSAVAHQDLDGDGFTVLEEYLFGLGVHTSDAAAVTQTTNGVDLVLEWNTPKHEAWYRVEKAVSLPAWSPFTEVVPVEVGGNETHLNWRLTLPLEGARGFFRIVVGLEPDPSP